MNRGGQNSASNKGLLALMWKDSRPVYFLSSIHDASLGQPVTRNTKVDGKYEKIEVSCPQLVIDYNGSMGGVDQCDQQSAVKKDKKQKRHYMRIFVGLFMKSINNAYILEDFDKPHIRPGQCKRDILSF